MLTRHYTSLLLAIAVGKSAAQGNITDVCQWRSLRAATVRDALYVNGGDLTVNNNGPGLNGSIFVFNFSQSFDTQNIDFSPLFAPLPAQPPTADYWDGAMFATDDKIYVYGGFLPLSARYPATPSDHVLGYQLYSEGSEPGTGPLNESLPTGLSNYITNGAGINVPTESLAYYFSGMVEADGSIPSFPVSTTMLAAESFIQVQMSSAQEASWSNLSWPRNVLPRANAQLVWLPVSSQGVLIVIGGVVDPSDLTPGASDNSSPTSDSQQTSPTFMTSLPVYDIAGQQWFVQDTGGETTSGWQLTEFCAVVAQATGSSSFEIFIYGGWNGLNGSALDDVWVLSIPSFTWVHVYPGTNSTHVRRSHACVKPYPDQMFAIGGDSLGGTSDASCFNQIIDVFNLSSLMWLEKYDPTVYADYSIPPIVASAISATPTAAGMDPTLAGLLGSKYGKNVTTYYPYIPSGTAVPITHPSSGPKWLPAVLGAVLGVVGLSVGVLVIWYCRRRRSRHSVTSGTGSGGGIRGWANRVTKPDASVTTTEVEDVGSPHFAGYCEVGGDLSYHPRSPPPAVVVEAEAGAAPRTATSPRSVHAEADGTERYEMHGVERRAPDVPVELATSYHFPEQPEASYRIRDHSLYPRNLDGASQTMSPSLGARSTTSHDLSTPPFYALPQRSGEAADGILRPAADASPLSSVDGGPPDSSLTGQRPSHRRNISSVSSGVAVSASPGSSPDLDTLERAFGVGYSNSRPAHPRNMSSLSSGIAQLPSPAEPVAAAEDQRRSAALSDLPSPEPAPRQGDPDTSEAAPFVRDPPRVQRLSESRNSRSVVTRKQVPGRSAFQEDLESWEVRTF